MLIGHHSVVNRLFAMAIALSVAALLLGLIADKLRQRGVRPQAILAASASLFIAVQVALILHLPVPSFVIWSLAPAPPRSLATRFWLTIFRRKSPVRPIRRLKRFILAALSLSRRALV